jgi:glycosyltransferase involved in cell wall biosynthesis
MSEFTNSEKTSSVNGYPNPAPRFEMSSTSSSQKHTDPPPRAQVAVSALVTVFNRERILTETIGSLLSSGFRELEIVIVDDCSKDDSWKICKQLESSSGDVPIRSFRNSENLGDYANRNQAAAYAQGRYLKYLDADDLIYPHSLQVMVDAMEQFPDAALALSANVIDPETPYPERIEPPEFFRRHFFGRSPIGVGPSAAIIRRDCFEAVGGFSGRQFVGDTELWLKLAERWPIVLLPPALVWWRRHEGQQMSQEQKRPEVLNVRFSLELEVLRGTAHLSPSAKLAAERRIRRIHARRLLSMAIRNRKLLTALKLFQASQLTAADLLRGFRKPDRPDAGLTAVSSCKSQDVHQ